MFSQLISNMYGENIDAPDLFNNPEKVQIIRHRLRESQLGGISIKDNINGYLEKGKWIDSSDEANEWKKIFDEPLGTFFRALKIYKHQLYYYIITAVMKEKGLGMMIDVYNLFDDDHVFSIASLSS